MIKKYKIIKFSPVFLKRKIKKIWQQHGFYLDFEKEWKNFLNICGNDRTESIFAFNNFLITEFLITRCGLKPENLNEVNCHCVQGGGEAKIDAKNYNKHKRLIRNFLANFNY
jgi:hypothetical protein